MSLATGVATRTWGLSLEHFTISLPGDTPRFLVYRAQHFDQGWSVQEWECAIWEWDWIELDWIEMALNGQRPTTLLGLCRGKQGMPLRELNVVQALGRHILGDGMHIGIMPAFGGDGRYRARLSKEAVMA